MMRPKGLQSGARPGVEKARNVRGQDEKYATDGVPGSENRAGFQVTHARRDVLENLG